MKHDLYRLSLDTFPEGEEKEKYRAWIEQHEDRCRRIIAKYDTITKKKRAKLR